MKTTELLVSLQIAAGICVSVCLGELLEHGAGPKMVWCRLCASRPQSTAFRLIVLDSKQVPSVYEDTGSKHTQSS